MDRVALLKKIVCGILFLGSLLVIVAASMVYVKKDVISNINSYHLEIDTYISNKLNIKTQSHTIKGEWYQLAPKINISNVTMSSKSNDQLAVTLDDIVFQINLIQSIFSRQLVSRELSIGHVNILMEESSAGTWSIAGKELGSKNSSFLDILFNTRYLEIQSINLSFRFISGVESTVKLNNISLENKGDFHRLLTKVVLQGNHDPIDIVVEANGEPKDIASFDVLTYSKFNDVHFNNHSKKLIQGFFPNIPKSIIETQADINADIWLSAKKDGKIELLGNLHSDQINHRLLKDTSPIMKIETGIRGWYASEDDLGLVLNNLNFSWDDLQIKPISITIIRKPYGGSKSISIDQIDLAILDDIIERTSLVPDNILELAQHLKPTGKIYNLYLTLGEKNNGSDIRLQANMENVSVDSWAGKPGFRQVNGYVEIQNKSGFLELDSPEGFSFYLPGIFNEYVHRSSIRGDISWEYNPNTGAIKIFSGLIKMNGDEGQGRASFQLEVPSMNSGLDPELYLSVGVKDVDARYTKSYIPDNLDKRLDEWLEKAIIDVKISEAGFLWRGPLVQKTKKIRKNSLASSSQVFLRTTDGKIKFHQDWPALTELKALVIVDSSTVSSQIHSARAGGATVKHAQLSINSAVKEARYLSIAGAVRSDFGEAIELLKKSPLRSRVIGLNNWILSGKSDISLDLKIPLTTHTSDKYYNIDMTLDTALMSLSNSAISLRSLQGVLSYRDEIGLFSPSVKGYLFDEPFVADLKTLNDNLLIDARGDITMPSLASFIGLKSNTVLKGKTDYIVNILVPLEDQLLPIKLNINTNMKGAEIALPAPFGKTIDTEESLSAQIIFGDRINLKINLGALVKSHLELEKNSIVKGILSIESDRSELPGENQFLIEGHLKSADLLQWKSIYPEIFNLDDTQNQQLTPLFNVVIDKIEFSGLSAEKVGISGGYQNGDWMLGIKSERLEGHLWIPKDPLIPILVDLERLMLPKLSEFGGTTDSIHPSEFPHLQLSVRNFSVGDKRFGGSKLLMTPKNNGVTITGIDANLLGLSIGDDETETSIEWTVDKNQHRTVFNGVLRIEDIGAVMKSWDFPAIMDSEEAQFLSQLNWSGKPWQISPETMNGSVAINIKKGHFYQESSGTANALIRLISLFNFDNWIRRLKLDFSDLYEKGMSYNQMDGGLIFEMGELTFDPPVNVDLPSGNIQLKGSANLVSEKIDAYLVTTLPVSNNLPWVAAAVGGLPVAAGVFITSKVFEKQVEKLSSISYSITGLLSSPEVVMEKFFNINTSSEAGNTSDKVDLGSTSGDGE